MTLLEGLYNLLILVVFVAVALGLLYVVAIYGHMSIEPKKIAAWWKGEVTRKSHRAIPAPPRWHPQGFDDYPHSS